MNVEERIKRMEEQLENIEKYRFILSEFFIEEIEKYKRIRQSLYILKEKYNNNY